MELFALLWRRARARVALMGLCGVFAGLVNTALFALMSGQLDSEVRLRRVVAFVGLAVLAAGTNTLPDILVSGLTRSTMSERRLALARMIGSAPLRRIEEIGRARIVSVFEVDLGTIVTHAGRLPLAVGNGTLVIGCLAYLAFLSPVAVALVAPLLLLSVAVNYVTVESITPHWKRQRASLDAATETQMSLLDGLKELKLHTQRKESFLGHVYGPVLDRLRHDSVRLDWTTSFSANIGYSFTWLCVGAAAFGIPLVVGDASVARAALLAVLYTAGLLQFVSTFSREQKNANLAMSRLKELELDLAVEDRGLPFVPSSPFGDGPLTVTLRRATFCYASEDDTPPFVSGPFDLAVSSSELVFVVGGNGSGKTTFGKLLCGLYVPTSGEIVCNGRLVDGSNREAYRNNFSAVFAEFHVFEHVHALEERADDRRAGALLGKLGLAGKVSIRNGRLSTRALSTGQRKRLALLVALLEDRPFYLFDEWAADQDPEFREVFYREILPDLARRGKAVVAISHDDRYFHLAHRLVRLGDGRVRPSVEMELS
jgi:putative pyoverdin transport system ATP-binding/permease protein